MMIRKLHSRERRGGSIVETAFAMLPITVLIFGVFEYGRFLMDKNLLNNAAREGCRYALVNNTSTTISTDVTNLVTNYMAGRSSSFSSFTVTVSGTHSGTATTVNNLAAGDLITVTVSGTYRFITFIPYASSAIPTTSAVTMICEGVT